MSQQKEPGLLRMMFAISLPFFVFGTSILLLGYSAHGEAVFQEHVRIPEKDPNFAPRFEMSPFTLWDAYVQAGKGRPQHLMHGRPDPIAVRVHERVDLWLTLRTREDVPNPCAMDAVHSCEFTVQLVDVSAGTLPEERDSIQVFKVRGGNEIRLQESFIVHPEHTAIENLIIARLVQGNQELFRIEFPAVLRR